MWMVNRRRRVVCCCCVEFECRVFSGSHAELLSNFGLRHLRRNRIKNYVPSRSSLSCGFVSCGLLFRITICHRFYKVRFYFGFFWVYFFIIDRLSIIRPIGSAHNLSWNSYVPCILEFECAAPISWLNQLTRRKCVVPVCCVRAKKEKKENETITRKSS